MQTLHYVYSEINSETNEAPLKVGIAFQTIFECAIGYYRKLPLKHQVSFYHLKEIIEAIKH